MLLRALPARICARHRGASGMCRCVQYLLNTAVLAQMHIICRYEGASCDVDINECVRGTANCPANAGCVNTDGGFDCPCYFGYAASGSFPLGLYPQRPACQSSALACVCLDPPAPADDVQAAAAASRLADSVQARCSKPMPGLNQQCSCQTRILQRFQGSRLVSATCFWPPASTAKPG